MGLRWRSAARRASRRAWGASSWLRPGHPGLNRHAGEGAPELFSWAGRGLCSARGRWSPRSPPATPVPQHRDRSDLRTARRNPRLGRISVQQLFSPNPEFGCPGTASALERSVPPKPLMWGWGRRGGAGSVPKRLSRGPVG